MGLNKYRINMNKYGECLDNHRALGGAVAALAGEVDEAVATQGSLVEGGTAAVHTQEGLLVDGVVNGMDRLVVHGVMDSMYWLVHGVVDQGDGGGLGDGDDAAADLPGQLHWHFPGGRLLHWGRKQDPCVQSYRGWLIVNP